MDKDIQDIAMEVQEKAINKTITNLERELFILLISNRNQPKYASAVTTENKMTTENELIEKVQSRIIDGLLTELEHELFTAWLKALNEIKNMEKQNEQ